MYDHGWVPLRYDSFSETQDTPTIALEVNENNNQELFNEHFNQAKDNSVNEISPHQDLINENIDVETSDEINGSQPELNNRKGISDGLILVPANQTFLLNVLEKEQKHKNEIVPRKHEV